jgi:hypothetical protein
LLVEAGVLQVVKENLGTTCLLQMAEQAAVAVDLQVHTQIIILHTAPVAVVDHK